MIPDRENIRFNALRNALYHSTRRRSLERINRVFNFLVVILGTAVISDALGQLPIPRYTLGTAIAAVGALQLVFDFGRQARDHQVLQRDYYSLLADIEASPEADDAVCAEWQSRMIRITADEPPVLRALDAKAYNDALDATHSFEASQRLRIPVLHQMFGGIWSFDGYNYRKISELGSH